nr:E3 SUMO-protein ligase SIZ1-like isoform X1 [Ipomoea batatas]GMD64504.1 E3 SUMO-protein ligase SIZ1-like isoform X1 [Ipomoea batatas]
MDLLGSCKDKLTYFRLKELKDVLTQLGVSKQGKKQDLVDRILTILSDERGKLSTKILSFVHYCKETYMKMVTRVVYLFFANITDWD